MIKEYFGKFTDDPNSKIVQLYTHFNAYRF
jgi:hypothetical protein